jgi:hypothetical protein
VYTVVHISKGFNDNAATGLHRSELPSYNGYSIQEGSSKIISDNISTHKKRSPQDTKTEHKPMIIKSLHNSSVLPENYLHSPSPPISTTAKHLVSAAAGVAAVSVAARDISASLSALHPALLDEILLLQHAAGLLHELAHGGVVLAVLGVVVLGGLVAVTVEGLLAVDLILCS